MRHPRTRALAGTSHPAADRTAPPGPAAPGIAASKRWPLPRSRGCRAETRRIHVRQVLPHQARLPAVEHGLHPRPAIDHHDGRMALSRLVSPWLEQVSVELLATRCRKLHAPWRSKPEVIEVLVARDGQFPDALAVGCLESPPLADDRWPSGCPRSRAGGLPAAILCTPGALLSRFGVAVLSRRML